MMTDANNDSSAITLFDNPVPRCPVVLLLDTSASMEGYPIQELNRGVKQFFNEITADEVARFSVETSIVTFGGSVKYAMEFTDCSSEVSVPTFNATGYTPLGEALNLGLNKIQTQRKRYRDSGVSSYKPWVIILSDGMPNDDWQAAAEKAKSLAAKGKIVYLGIGVGDNIDMNLFSQLLPGNCPPKKLAGLKFVQFFKWLSDSLKSVSQSAPGQQVNMPSTGGWESIQV
jgi:uncharacterized protein YegL